MSVPGSVPVVRPGPAWLRYRYLLAGGLALVAAPVLWGARNFLSDRAFYSATRKAGTEKAYKEYVANGWLNVDEVRADLPRVAFEEAKSRRTAAALRTYLASYPSSPLAPEARIALDRAYLALVEADGAEDTAAEGLGLDELMTVLQRVDSGRVRTAAVARFVPAPAAGGECAKDWIARLSGDATTAKGLLARALLRSRCEGFLQQLVTKDKALLARYKVAVEDELRAPAPTTALAARQIRDFATVVSHAALFSPALGAGMLDAIRRSRWTPDAVPGPGEIDLLKAGLSGSPALASATMDYMQQANARWGPSKGDLRASPGLRPQYLKLLDLAGRVRTLGRPDLSAEIAAPATAAFRAEVAHYAKETPNEIAAFLNSGAANPFVVELADLLAAAGRPVFVYSFAAGAGSVYTANIVSTLRTAAGDKLSPIACDAAACDRIPRRVKIRVSDVPNDYCYVKYFSGFGFCANPGRRVTVTFTYLRGDRVLGSEQVTGETPSVVTYRRSAGADLGPTTADVSTATGEAVRQKLGSARLRLPF